MKPVFSDTEAYLLQPDIFTKFKRREKEETNDGRNPSAYLVNNPDHPQHAHLFDRILTFSSYRSIAKQIEIQGNKLMWHGHTH